MTFEELYARLCSVLRGKEAPVVIRILRPDGTSRVIREDSLQVPDSHKRELDRRFKKYADDASALQTEEQLKNAVNSRR